MTRHFVESLALPYNFPLLMGIRDTPVLELRPGEFAAIHDYCDMVKGLLQTCRPFQAETRKLSNDEMLMQRFLHELHIHYKTERKVLFYADRLHVTPGYLSTLVRGISGRTASEWINNFVLLEAKIMLKSTKMTIQQVSQ